MELRMLRGIESSPRVVKRWSLKNHTAPLMPNLHNTGPNIKLLDRSNSFSSMSTADKKKPSSKIKITTDDESFTPPDAELAARIVEQVEFYFSDVNIMKDTFLLQHMKHNKDGFISLKLLSGFKRIKHLVKNWRELAHVMENGSQLLQLNEERTKLRRIAPLPTYDETTPSRTIVAFELPLEKPITIKNVVSLFSPCGKIVLVRILLPKNPLPADVRPYLTTLPEMQGTEACALIEFADLESVKCALQYLPASAQAAPLAWGSMRVHSLIQQQVSNYQVTMVNSGHRGSFQSNYPMMPSPLASPRLLHRDASNRRHSSPNIQQYTPTARRRTSLIVPENIIRFPRGPDGTRGFRDRHCLPESDTE